MMATITGGCGKAQETAQAGDQPTAGAEKQNLRLAFSISIPSLDPQLANSMPAQTMGSSIMEGLVRVSGGQISPGIAEKWDLSEDGLTYTFHLREAKWSDDVPVTAKDFEYGIKRLADPKTGSPFAFAANYIMNGEKVVSGDLDVDQLAVKALDDKTLEIKVPVPEPFFLGMLNGVSFYPARQDIIEKYGKDFAASPDKMVFNGPFIMTEWVKENRMKLDKNHKYWDKDNVKLDTVEVLNVDNRDTQTNMFENGELDYLDIRGEVLERYKNEGKFPINKYSNGAVAYFKFNAKSDNPLMNNDNFRKAVAYGLDRKEYTLLTYKGKDTPATRYILPAIAGVEKTFVEEHPLTYYSETADLEKAKDYLAKAMQELNITDPAKLEFSYLVYDTGGGKSMGEAIQGILKKNLGITVNVELAPYADKIDRELKLDYEACDSGWCPDYDDPMTYLDLWLSDSTQNSCGYSNPKYDELVKFAKASSDFKARGDAMFEAEKILLEDAYIVPLTFDGSYWVGYPYLKGLVRNYIGADPDFVHASVEGKESK
ncbi:MAG TPA: peptide ABC transporter substrate-binding protein, partial [Clostridia bacterium]|nr:peptide ABC transporter substrate-binding protein [Clostridia bacterium]